MAGLEDQEPLDVFVATGISTRNAVYPEEEGCARMRPPCCSTMRQQAFNERLEILFSPDEVRRSW